MEETVQDLAAQSIPKPELGEPVPGVPASAPEDSPFESPVGYVKPEEPKGFFESSLGSVNSARSIDKARERDALITAAVQDDILNGDQYVKQASAGDLSEIKATLESLRTLREADNIAELQAVLADDTISKENKQRLLLSIANDVSVNRASLQANVALSKQEPVQTPGSTEQQQERTEVQQQNLRENITEWATHEKLNRATFDGNPGADFAAAIFIPFLYGPSIFETLNNVFPAVVTKDEALGSIAPGKIIQEYKQHINKMWAEDPDNAKEKIRELIDAISNNEVLWHSNDAVNHWMFQSLIDGIEDTDSMNRVLESAFGFLDATAVFGLFAKGGRAFTDGLEEGMRGAFKDDRSIAETIRVYKEAFYNVWNRKTPGSISDKLDKAAPDKSMRVHAEILKSEDGVKLAEKLLHEKLVNIFDSHLNSRVDGTQIMGLPDLNEPLTARANQQMQTGMLSEADKAVGASRISEDAKRILDIRGEFHLNKSVIRDLNDGLEVDAVYGKNKKEGWKSIHEVNLFIEDLPDHSRIDPRILVRNKTTNEVLPVDEVPVKERAKDYYLQVTQRDEVIPGDTAGVKPFDEKGMANEASKYFDKSSYLTDLAMHAENLADDKTANFHKVLNEVKKPYTSLGAHARSLVGKALDDGDFGVQDANGIRRSFYFKPSELRDRWGHRRDAKKLMQAYYSVVAHNRVARHLINEAARKSKKSQGIVRTTIDGQTVEGSVKDFLPKGTNRVLDPATGEIKVLSPDEIKALSKEGGQFFKLSNPKMVPQEGGLAVRANYALKSGLKLEDLPYQVMPDLDGFLPRIYDASHRVVQQIKFVKDTGEVVTRWKTIGLAKTARDADTWKARLLAEDPKAAVEVQRVAESSSRSLGDTTIGLDEVSTQGELFYSRRGPELKDLNGKRIQVSAQERLKALTDRAANASHMDFFLEKQLRDFEILYPEFMKDGKIPFYGELPDIPNATEAQIKAHAEATAMRDRMMIQLGHNPSKLASWWESSAVRLSEVFSRSFLGDNVEGQGISKWIYDQKNNSWFDPLKQIAFLDFIIMAPFRQLPLQMNQISIYAAEDYSKRYLASPKGVREYYGLWRGMMSRDSKRWDVMVPTLAKQTGMSVAEYTKFIDTIRGSGMFANIDSHAFADGISMEMLGNKDVGAIKGVLSDSYRNVKGVAKIFRKIGFDLGEAAHLATSILVQRNRWLRENPGRADEWADPKNYAEIFGRARALAGNMTKSGTLAFQKGPLGLAMQFQSHNWKMRQMLLPRTLPLPKGLKEAYENSMGKLASKAFTNRQYFHLMAAQMVTYGPVGAFGVYTAYDHHIRNSDAANDLKENNPDTFKLIDQAFKEGVFGTMVNGLANSIEDKEFLEQTLDVSGNFGPMSGVAQLPMERVLLSQSFGTFDWSQLPFFATSEKVLGALKVTSALVGANIHATATDSLTGLPEDTNTALAVLEQGAAVFSQLGKIQQARTGAAMERIISQTNNHLLRASTTEIRARVLGAESTKARRVNELYYDLRGSYIEAKEPALTSEKKHAKWLYETAINVIHDQTLGEGADLIADWRKVERTVDHLMHFTKLIYWDSPEKFEYIQGEVRDLIAAHEIGQSGNVKYVPTNEESLVHLLTRLSEDRVPDLDSKLRELRGIDGIENISGASALIREIEENFK